MLAPSIGRYYAQAVVVPSIPVVAGNILLGVIDAEKNKNYKSEWLDEAAILQVVAVMTLLHIGLVCVLSLTMFFNEKEKVRKHTVLRIVTWFAAPLGWLGYLLGSALLDGWQRTFTDEHLWVALNTVPYAVALLVAYFNFRKKLEYAGPLVAK